MCTITALLKLVSHEESAESTSLANKEFDIELEKDNTAKSHSACTKSAISPNWAIQLGQL